jgi:hypothetical protein
MVVNSWEYICMASHYVYFLWMILTSLVWYILCMSLHLELISVTLYASKNLMLLIVKLNINRLIDTTIHVHQILWIHHCMQVTVGKSVMVNFELIDVIVVIIMCKSSILWDPFLYQQIAPFNTYYPRLGEHMTQVGVDPSTNKWDQPFVLGVVDPHDSLSHPAGVSDVQAESAICVDPDLFTNFLVCQVYCELNSGLVWLSTIFFSCIIFLNMAISFCRSLICLTMQYKTLQNAILFHCLKFIRHHKARRYIKFDRARFT